MPMAVRDGMERERLRVAIVGCGDVAQRWYLPALSELAAQVELVACCDTRAEAAEQLARRAAVWWPEVTSHADLPEMFASSQLDAAFTLTPAPRHAVVTEACLEAGLHVYSEKPLAGSLAEADRLIALARERDLLLLCAPAEAVTARVRWLARIVESGRLGRLTLAVAHHADTGPATWREYTGDPEVFYGKGVGPVFDHGVYRLHAMTALLGPVRRVQAMGTISEPKRMVRAGPRAGQTIAVTSPDHVLMNLEFANGALGQLLTSFAAPGTQAPWLELHFTRGSISFGGQSHDKDAPASIYFDDESDLGLEGWVHGLRPPRGEVRGVVESGVHHFIACLRGEETPVLTGEHARHVLDIILKAYESIDDGQVHQTETAM
jgi:predicted dehydrogenase